MGAVRTPSYERVTKSSWKEVHMHRIRILGREFVRSDEGIAVTEYGLLVALVAVLLIGVVTLFGSSIRSWFADKTSQITTV